MPLDHFRLSLITEVNCKMLRFTCLVLLVSLAVGLELKAQIKDHWQSFKAAHKKSYEAGEENERKEIFKKNVERVLQHNLKSDLGESTHQLGINEFSDMSHEEFVQKFLGLRADLANKTEKRYADPIEMRQNIPATLDWRQSGYVGPVKNQGSCGSCWSFAANGALESRYYQATGQRTVLSEQNLVDCSTNGNYGCDGGLPDNAFQYIINNGGVDSSYCYPYETRVGSCRFNRNCVGATMRSFRDIRYGDENDLLVAAASGAVAVGIDAGQQDFQIYRSGIYNPSYCSQTPNHAVLVIGYGTENGQKYWLVKNSWGTSWGTSGFFKLARNAGNKCGVANLASYPVV